MISMPFFMPYFIVICSNAGIDNELLSHYFNALVDIARFDAATLCECLRPHGFQAGDQREDMTTGASMIPSRVRARMRVLPSGAL